MTLSRVEKGNTTDFLPISTRSQKEAGNQDLENTEQEQGFESLMVDESGENSAQIQAAGHQESGSTKKAESSDETPLKPEKNIDQDKSLEESAQVLQVAESVALLQSLYFQEIKPQEKINKIDSEEVTGELSGKVFSEEVSQEMAPGLIKSKVKKQEMASEKNDKIADEKMQEKSFEFEALKQESFQQKHQIGKSEQKEQQAQFIEKKNVSRPVNDQKINPVESEDVSLTELLNQSNLLNKKESGLQASKKIDQNSKENDLVEPVLMNEIVKNPKSVRRDTHDDFQKTVTPIVTAHHKENLSTDRLTQVETKQDFPKIEDVASAQSVQKQVREALRANVKEVGEEVVVQLDPPEWGRVQVQFKIDKNEVHIQFVVENSFVKEALDKGMAALRVDFDQQGLSLGNVQVGVGGNFSSENQNQERAYSSESGFVNPTTQKIIQATQATTSARRSNALVDAVV